MQSPPKISIITPSFNQGDYIEDTIQSILGQGYPNLEYIIIDGGSTDSTVEIIKKYETQITHWVSEKDEGQSDAINKGLKMATGDIVAWLNSDDTYTEGALQKIANAFAGASQPDIVFGDVENFYDSGRAEVIRNDFDPVDFLNRVSIHQPAVFWKRSLHDQFGYLDKSLFYLMDYDLWARLFFNCKWQRLDAVLSRFRIHGTSKTNDNPPGLYYDYRKVFSRFINSLSDKTYKQQLQRLGIYDNTQDVAYPMTYPFEKPMLQQIVDNYIFNCIVQEYTFGKVVNTNRLIMSTTDSRHERQRRSIWLKNLLGIGYWKKQLRK